MPAALPRHRCIVGTPLQHLHKKKKRRLIFAALPCGACRKRGSRAYICWCWHAAAGTVGIMPRAATPHRISFRS